MLTRFITHIQQQHLFPSGQQVLLAVSGGIDSVVLAHLMYSAGYPFAIAHCNFHLRPGDCDRDEAFVRQLAQQYGAHVHVAQFDTLQYSNSHHLCVEDAARRLRYDFFDQLRDKHHYAAILTAHHRDDATETFFINLLRGTGLAGLHGIVDRQGYLVRPLLPFSRAEIEQYAATHHLSHVEDVTNASLDYRRNQIRHQVMPLLRQIQPSADQALQQTILHLQSVESLYQSLLQPFLVQYVTHQDDGKEVVSLDFAQSPHAHQILFEILRPYQFNSTTVRQVLACRQSGKLFSSPTHTLLYDRGKLIISPIIVQSVNALPQIKSEIVPQFDYDTLPLRSLPSNQAYFDADKVRLPLKLRHWVEGDRFQPLGLKNGSQLVSDFFTDHKFSLIQKQSQLILVDASNTIIWIVGHRTTHPHRVTPQTRRLLIVTILPSDS